jgi:hypothetical protein
MNDGSSSRLSNFINQSMRQKTNFSLTINKKTFESKQKYILSESTKNSNFINKLLLETTAPIGLPQMQNNTYILQLTNTIIKFHKELTKIKEYQHFSAADTNDLLVSNGFRHFPKSTFDQLNLETYRNYTTRHLTPIYKEYKSLIRYYNPTSAPTTTRSQPQKRANVETQTSFEEPIPKRRQIEPTRTENPRTETIPEKSTPTSTPKNQTITSGITITSKRIDNSLKQITNLTATSTPIKRTPGKTTDKHTAFERFINYIYTQISEEKPLNAIKLKDWRKNNSKETSGLKTQVIEAEIGTKISETSIKAIIEHYYVHLGGDKSIIYFIVNNYKFCQMEETIKQQFNDININELETEKKRQLYLQLFADTSDNEDEPENKENKNQVDTSIELI